VCFYHLVQVCPTTAGGAVTCPEAQPMIDNVTEAMCTSFGCCFLNLVCYSKQETVQGMSGFKHGHNFTLLFSQILFIYYQIQLYLK
jgi:hypothetical protein